MRSRRDRRMSRGEFMNLGGMSAAALAFGCSRRDPEREAARRISFPGYPFGLGVASGDPLSDGVVLWTRLAPKPLDAGGGMPNREVAVRWEVAEDEGFRKVVRKGEEVASPSLAHSVHAEVEGLDSGRWYFYRFEAGGETSPVGRTRTAPERGVSEMSFAFASCQKWDDGFYSAYRRMSEEDLDLVVHLGDYIYEYGIGENGGARGVSVPEQFRSQASTLEGYRLRHALYKTDPDLQSAHAAFPWLVTWDDHDVDDDYVGENSNLLDRRAAAYRAYHEHMPLRRSAMPEGPDMPLYRRVAYGDLAEFAVLDTRQYRSEHPCGGGVSSRCDAALDPSATMAGPDQERWLLEGLDRSESRWNVIAQQVLMAQLDHIDGEGAQYWNDSWDGYPAARSRILRHLENVANPVVITGDWHSTFVSDLKPDFKDPASPTVASEFACTSISSNGDDVVFGPYYGPMIPENPHIKFFDGDRRGYVRCHINRERWLADLRMVETVSRPDAPIHTLASFAVEAGDRGVHKA